MSARPPARERGADDVSPYDPLLYELVHRGTPGDVDMYVRRLAGARRVLELGCGWGRVLEALHRAEPERELLGLDLDPGLLERARARVPSAKLWVADMRSFRVDAPVDAVILPYSALWCLDENEDVIACFEAARAALAPGGRLICDAYAADAFHDVVSPEPDDDAPSFVAEIHDGARGFRVFESARWEPERQGFWVSYLHEPLEGGEPIRSGIRHTYRLEPELRGLLEAAGFSRIRTYGGFDLRPFDAEADHLVVEAWQVG